MTPPVLAADLTHTRGARPRRPELSNAFTSVNSEPHRKIRIVRSQARPAHSHHADAVSDRAGQGDLSKGKLVCQRVSELAARADIAKQIRVLVKEHATDRLRGTDRSGSRTGHRSRARRNRSRNICRGSPSWIAAPMRKPKPVRPRPSCRETSCPHQSRCNRPRPIRAAHR